MVKQAILLPGGGISKVNIATDLELAVLDALGREERMSDAECRALPPEALESARAAVERVVIDKICNFLGSDGRAAPRT
jgi:fructose-bisphosphate aldolase class II